ncbi:MAG TPA: hypothetical protein VGB50_06180 [Flavobacterium sp.]|jgi:hypothetical protein
MKNVLLITVALLSIGNVFGGNLEGENKTKYPIAAEEISTPDSFLKRYVKTTEEIIAENNKIIDSVIPDPAPICTRGNAAEDSIAEDNRIIESTVSNEFHPLNFKKINSRLLPNNTVRKGF